MTHQTDQSNTTGKATSCACEGRKEEWGVGGWVGG